MPVNACVQATMLTNITLSQKRLQEKQGSGLEKKTYFSVKRYSGLFKNLICLNSAII